MKKWIAGALVATTVVCGGLFAGCNDDTVLENMKTYIVTDSIFDLEIEIKAATVEICKGEEFYVESNLKYLTVEDDGGCLSVVEGGDEADRSGNGKVYIYIPDVTLGSVHAETGVGKVLVSYLSAQNLYWELGAGETKMTELYIEDNTEIVGGAGSLSISGGVIHNLDMTVGVGKCSFTGELTGDSILSCGVGQLTLNLRGLKEDYCLEITTGLGGATVDGKSVTDGTVIGSGDNFIDVSGGVGGVSVNFIGESEKVEDDV